MGFDDLFENKRKFQGNRGNRDYPENTRNTYDSRYPYYGNDNNFSLSKILFNIRNNKKLKRLVLFAILFILAIVVILVIVLLPFILKLVNYISQNGLQGIIEYILGIVDKIWKGSVK